MLCGRVHNLVLEDYRNKDPIRLKIVPKWQVEAGGCSTQPGPEEVPGVQKDDTFSNHDEKIEIAENIILLYDRYFLTSRLSS